MRRGLVSNDIGPHATTNQFGENFRGVSEQTHGHRLSIEAGLFDHRQSFVEGFRLPVEIARAQPHLDPRRLAFDSEAGGSGHDCCERLRSAHAAESGGQNPFA